VEVLPNWQCAHHDIILSPVLESKKKQNRHGKWRPCQTLTCCHCTSMDIHSQRGA